MPHTIQILDLSKEYSICCPDLLGIAWHVAQDGLIASFGKDWEIEECVGERTTYREVSLHCIHGHPHGSRIYQQFGEDWILLEEAINGEACPLCVEKLSIGCPRCAKERFLHINVNKDHFCPGCGTVFK